MASIGAPSDPCDAPCMCSLPAMGATKWGGIVGAAALVAGALVVAGLGSAGATAPVESDGARITPITMSSPTAYTPYAPAGATDDYHCTLVNPHVTHNSFIVASQFFPGHGPSSVEVHHAILFLVPPSLAKEAEADNVGNKGWTCFGETPIPNTPLSDISNTPWLSAWAPGHGLDVLPKGTGTPLPAGSLVVMQVHYNLLVGDKPVKTSLRLDTVPASAKLRPTSLQLYPAPPDVPCATGVTGPLCTRTASLANLQQRFGTDAVDFVNTLESICGHNPTDPPVGDTTSCDWQVGQAGYVVRVSAHMHLLGQTLSIILNPGTKSQKTLLDVNDYNFHYQRAYNLKKWVEVKANDTIRVSCSYNPALAQELPALRNAPAHFVTWGDGSSDEMCLGLVETVPLNPHASVAWPTTGTTTPSS